MIYLGNTPVGIADKGVGDFTKHQQVKVTPSDAKQISVNHSLGVVPKIVVVTSTQTYVSSQFMFDGILMETCGGMRFMSGAGTFNGYYYPVEIDGSPSSGTTQKAYMSNSNVTIMRGASTRQFDTNTEYTVDIYA